jgi:hypothetical protein
MKRFAPLARPSAFLMAASLFVLIAAALSLAPGGEAGGDAAGLRARGWQSADRAACEQLRSGAYYEIGNEEGTVEALALADGSLLASRLPLPEAPYECREIPEPHFVEEIR